MSSNDDRTHTDAPSSRGRRGGKNLRGRNKGRGFHFGLAAQMALTQHLLSRGRSLLPPATDAVSLTIGNFHDAPLNARRLDKNVYPSAVIATTSLRPTSSTCTTRHLVKTSKVFSHSLRYLLLTA